MNGPQKSNHTNDPLHQTSLQILNTSRIVSLLPALHALVLLYLSHEPEFMRAQFAQLPREVK